MGYLVDPQEFFDAPSSKAEFEKLANSAQAIAAIISITSATTQGETSQKSEPSEHDKAPEDSKAKESAVEEPEVFGPKTAELPT